MRKRSIAALTLFLSLGGLTRAQETVEVARYWPDDGIWIHYIADPSAYEIGIWVYCGFGCTEWSNLYPVPPLDVWVQDPVSHSYYTDRPAWYAQIEHSWGESTYSGNAKAVWDCDDLRSDLNQEYIDTYSGNSVYFFSGYLPNCDPWDGGWATGPDYPNFSWEELNGGFTNGNPHRPYGIIRAALINGLQATRTNFGGPIPLSGAYRCPHGNASLPGAAFNSRHVHGRAADMCAAGQPDCGWTQESFTALKMAAEATSPPPVESFPWERYPDHHYHAAW